MKTILLTNQYTGAPLEIVQSVVPEGFRIQFLEEQTQEALERRAGPLIAAGFDALALGFAALGR